MTKIKFNVENENIRSFEIKGHSNLSEYGKDIVCASISSVTLMTINGLIEVYKVDVEYTIYEGYVWCEVKNIDESQKMLHSLKIFLEELANKYPKNVKLQIKEV